MTETVLRFSESYSVVVSRTYGALKEEILKVTIFIFSSFFLLGNNEGTYSTYFQNNITKLIVHLPLSDQLPYVSLQEFYTHSMYVIDLCI